MFELGIDMAKADKPLTANQSIMLEKLKAYSLKSPYMPATSAERRTCESLEWRGVAGSELSLSSQVIRGGRRETEFKLAYYVKPGATSITVDAGGSLAGSAVSE